MSGKSYKTTSILSILLAIALTATLLIGCGSVSKVEEPKEESKKEGYEWPSDSEVASMLPAPEGAITSVNYDDDKEYGYLTAEVTITDGKICKDYIDKCKDKGFTEDANLSQSDGDYSYEGKNKDGWDLYVYNYDEQMSISLNAPSDEEETVDDSEEEEPVEEDDVTEAETESKSEKSNKGTADFKQTMDEYEEFMDEYVKFMKKYTKSDDPTAALADYSKIMQKYTDFAAKIDQIDENSLSTEDYNYYMEVMNRVNKKLAEIGQ